MTVVAHLWRPVCPHCGRVASDRSALGDERGPAHPRVGPFACGACGKRVEDGAILRWELAAVERDDAAAEAVTATTRTARKARRG